MSAGELIEGYASIFGVADLSGDVVRGGAFAASLARMPTVPMLLQHRPGAIVGRWLQMRETGRGLYVRGLVHADSATRLLDQGLDGLSIGFRPRMWRRQSTGRTLAVVELVEVSLVAKPMHPQARLTRLRVQPAAA